MRSSSSALLGQSLISTPSSSAARSLSGNTLIGEPRLRPAHPPGPPPQRSRRHPPRRPERPPPKTEPSSTSSAASFACSGTTFAKIAARSEAAVIPGFAFWSDAEQRHILHFYPEVPITGDLEADTAAIQKAVEVAVPYHPPRSMALDPPPLENPTRRRTRVSTSLVLSCRTGHRSSWPVHRPSAANRPRKSESPRVQPPVTSEATQSLRISLRLGVSASKTAFRNPCPQSQPHPQSPTLLTNIGTIGRVTASNEHVSFSGGRRSACKRYPCPNWEHSTHPARPYRRRSARASKSTAKPNTSTPAAPSKTGLAMNMILDGERSGKLKPGGTILDSTSGNTGIALCHGSRCPRLQGRVLRLPSNALVRACKRILKKPTARRSSSLTPARAPTAPCAKSRKSTTRIRTPISIRISTITHANWQALPL